MNRTINLEKFFVNNLFSSNFFIQFYFFKLKGLVGSGLFRCLCLGRSVCLLIRPDATPALDRDRQYMSSYIYHLAPGTWLRWRFFAQDFSLGYFEWDCTFPSGHDMIRGHVCYCQICKHRKQKDLWQELREQTSTFPCYLGQRSKSQ